MVLAAHEMDENHLSKFSFRNKENFLQVQEDERFAWCVFSNFIKLTIFVKDFNSA